MSERPKFFLTTAIDYPNARPHIGTAFEKLGADVQARYRRMQGFEVFLLMGNDENTVKVARKAVEVGQDPRAYCDDMARQFREVWDALGVQYDAFVQTSHERHYACARKFIQKVYDNGYIYKGGYEGLYCDGCESFKTEKELEDGNCPLHKRPVVRRTEPCYYFKQSAFEQQLLRYYEEHPELIQPDSRRNEILEYVKGGLRDINITRTGEDWGIRVPWDPEFTIYVWFDALLTYITGIGYGDDEAQFSKWWPADVHVIGKDITRFHCALWPAMLWAAGLDAPKTVFGHGFVYRVGGVKESKALGNVTDPMDLITKFNAEAFRYYFLRECPYPGDGEYSLERFANSYNADLANNLGNLYSRVVRLVTANYGGTLEGGAGRHTGAAEANIDVAATVREVQEHVEAFQFNQALEKIWRQALDPANRFADSREPWKVVKTDKDAARRTLLDMVEPLRVAAILLKPFLPKTAETIYNSFSFAKPWAAVRYEDAARPPEQPEPLRVVAELDGGKVKPLFPRID